jgi:prepilin-type N-terminal cleavage/methylation domain-containing protein
MSGMGRTQPATAGITLIELMVVLAIVGLLLALGLPAFSVALADMRDRSAMEKFLQDYEWLRGMAGRPGVTAATLALNADCSWTASLSTSAVPTPTADTAHSLSAADIAQMRAVLACSGAGAVPIALPASFSISSAGFVTPNGSVQFQGRHQTWPLQVLFSGSLVRLKGAQ